MNLPAKAQHWEHGILHRRKPVAVFVRIRTTTERRLLHNPLFSNSTIMQDDSHPKSGYLLRCLVVAYKAHRSLLDQLTPLNRRRR